MNALQAAVAMVFAGALAIVISWAVGAQAQAVFEEEARAAAQALLDSVVNQVRTGVATALLPGVCWFAQEVSLPAYAPPFDAYQYAVTISSAGGVLYVSVVLEAYRGGSRAAVALGRAVYNVSALAKPPEEPGWQCSVVVLADDGSTHGWSCLDRIRAGRAVDLTQDGSSATWRMPATGNLRCLFFNVTCRQAQK
jgi:hypothetical protein